jgi:hypothetical protein
MKYKDDELLEDAYNNIFENKTKKELVEEGLWDRVKGAASGVKKAADWGVQNVTDPDSDSFKKLGSEITKGFKSGRASSIVNSHVSKLNNQIDDFISDLKKIGSVTEDSIANYDQTAVFLKGIIKKIATTSGKGNVTLSDLKGSLKKAGFLDKSDPSY